MAQDLLHRTLGGFVRVHILYHAAKGPIWGVEVMAELARHGYRLGPGTLYPILHQLHAAGYLRARTAVVSGRRRKHYQITAAGRTFLKHARQKLRELTAELLDDGDRMHAKPGGRP
jgi:PadR family transcriptional regulator, regulatory protein PadR